MKLDLSALPPEQREALREIVDKTDRHIAAGLRDVSPRSIAAECFRLATETNARICAAITRAEQAQQKGARK